MSSSSSSVQNHRPRRPTRSIPAPPSLPPISTDSHAPPEQTPSFVASPVSEERSQSDLTPLRAHYLKKTLIQLQFNHELDSITTAAPNNISTFSFLGPPFSPPPKDAPNLHLPFLRYIFRQFVLTFPFMAAAPKDFYSDKLQPFMASMLSRNLSPTSIFDEDPEHSEQATRLKLLAKFERNLSLFLGAATHLVEPEEVVRLSQADLDRLEELSKKRQAKNFKEKDIFEVNIVSVRTVVDKGRVRSRVHEEFIVRTRRSHLPDCFVSRRYGDFRTLANELRKAHPQEEVRPPPPKDRTTVSAPPTASSPLSPLPSKQYSSEDHDQPMYSPNGQPRQQNSMPSRLAREKNRLTLRAYLHSLLTSYTISSSPVLKSFLLSDPTTLSAEEREDAQRREEADHVRDEGRKKFAREIANRVDGLRDAVNSVKGDIMGKDGLTRIFATIKVTSNVQDLPQNYKAVMEWARMSLASTVFHQFVASDNASETFASVKRLHGLMPYFMLKTALKISNPMGMIRTILDLFLAQPFGGKSLLQRMFTGSLTEEVRALEEEIEAVKAKVDDPIMCEKIRQFVYAPREIQDTFKADAISERMNLLTVVLRSGDEPVLSRAQMHRVAKAHRAHAAYARHRETLADSDDDDGPQDDDAWLYEDLKVLANLFSRMRDREQLIALVFEGFTADLLKDIITIFYAPLAQVYRAASIADSLGDLQNFINDLIKTVEQTEELSQEDPHQTVQAFIDLIQRHEQAFYEFVHKVHTKGEGLFDSLMRWIELFITVMREGLTEPISLEFLLPHTGKERVDILEEVDKVALYHYKLKVIYEDKIRKRFGRAQQNASDADAEDEATQALVNGVMGEISFGELIRGDADDLAAQETDEESDDPSDQSESETESEEEDSSDEVDSEDDTSSDESRVERPARLQSTPRPAITIPARSSTISTGGSRTSGQFTPSTPLSPQTPKPTRPRTLSLRSSRSMTFRSSPRFAADVPPVPPLPPPKNYMAAALSKPLPPSPSPSRSSFDRAVRSPLPSSSSSLSSSDHLPPLPKTPLRHSRIPSDSVPIPPKKAKLRKRTKALTPPELHHIPKLLPVFSEMMRPLLRPRARTNGPSNA